VAHLKHLVYQLVHLKHPLQDLQRNLIYLLLQNYPQPQGVVHLKHLVVQQFKHLHSQKDLVPHQLPQVLLAYLMSLQLLKLVED
jgi:hypothetical protein